MTPARRVVADGLVFPESPRWHDDRLWFSDMHGRRVLSTTVGGEPRVEATFDDEPSGIGFLPDGTPVVATMRSMSLWRLQDGAPTLHADLSGFRGEFLNDMVVDEDGRAYVGARTHRRRGEPPTEDLLLVVTPDGTAEVAAEGVVGPNGAVITPDGGTFILAETQAHRITAFDRAPDGSLSARRTFAETGRDFPDGLCLDSEGAVWTGTAIGRALVRLRDGGEETHRVEDPERWLIACTLGGPDRRTMFLCTAVTSLDGLRALSEAHEPRDHDERLAWARTQSQGWIEAFEVDVAGAGTP